MVKNVKHCSANVRWHLRTLSVAKAQNINSAPRARNAFIIYCMKIAKGESAPRKAKTVVSTGKVMATVF